ncbi:MAG: FAD-binding oxidoreductase [Candidatus Nanopelagicales bacterium]
MSNSPTPDASELLGRLRSVAGEAHVLDEAGMVAPFVIDWTRRFTGPCLAVVRPGSTHEVAEVLRACSAAGQPVLVQGGNTGLVGGGVPAGHGRPPVVVSTTRLSAVGEVDSLAGQITVGAGATLGAVQRAARAAGWLYGVDLGARESATIGGTVATNAGGMHVIAYGMTRAQVVGIEAVLADGTVISHLGGLLKDNTGFDFASLLCGSEGTLAVITAVRLRLHRPHPRTSLAVVGCQSYAQALALMADAAAAGQLIAAEMVDATGLALAESALHLNSPLEHSWPVAVFIEVADGGDGSGLPLASFADVAIALNATDQARLWALRERQAEAYGTLGVVHKLDVSVPLPALAEVMDELERQLGAAGDVSHFGFFGHLADGNIHVEFLGPDADDLTLDHEVLATVARHGGSISAEHGIGRLKIGSLHLSRSQEEIAAMRAIKDALDPQGLLNAGVLIPDRVQSGNGG